MNATDWLALLTVVVLVAQTIILYRQTQIGRRQSEIQKTQLELSETVSLSAEPYFDAKANRLKVNFKNEGKGTAQSTDVRYILTEKDADVTLIAVSQLRPLGPGSKQEIDITPKEIQTLLSKYHKLILSWQGIRADGKKFTGSLPDVVLSQIETINRF